MSDVVADSKRWREESERECREQVKELTLLQTWPSNGEESLVRGDAARYPPPH
jgi:hypothetical protein